MQRWMDCQDFLVHCVVCCMKKVDFPVLVSRLPHIDYIPYPFKSSKEKYFIGLTPSPFFWDFLNFQRKSNSKSKRRRALKSKKSKKKEKTQENAMKAITSTIPRWKNWISPRNMQYKGKCHQQSEQGLCELFWETVDASDALCVIGIFGGNERSRLKKET